MTLSDSCPQRQSGAMIDSHYQEQHAESHPQVNAHPANLHASPNATNNREISNNNQQFASTSASAGFKSPSATSPRTMSLSLESGKERISIVVPNGNLAEAVDELRIDTSNSSDETFKPLHLKIIADADPIDVSNLTQLNNSSRQSHRIALPFIQTRFNNRNRGSTSVSRSKGKGSSSSQSTSGYSTEGVHSTINTPFTTYDSQMDSPEVSTALTTPSSILYQPSYRSLGSEKHTSARNNLQEVEEYTAGDLLKREASHQTSLTDFSGTHASSLSSHEGQSEIILINVKTLRSWLQRTDLMAKRQRSILQFSKIGDSNVKKSTTSGRPTTASISNPNLDTFLTNNTTTTKTLITFDKFPDQIVGGASNPIQDSIGNLEFQFQEKGKEDDSSLKSRTRLPLLTLSSGKNNDCLSSPPSLVKEAEAADTKQSTLHKYPRKDGLIDNALSQGDYPVRKSRVDTTLPILLVIEDHQQIRADKRNTLELDYTLHIGIPDNLIDQYFRRERIAADFTDLKPLLIDEMSKRKYSTMTMDVSEGSKLEEYWRKDIVVIDHPDEQEDESEMADSSQSGSLQDQEESDYTDTTSLTSSPSLSAAATVLVDATQKLREMHGMHPRPIYLLKGDLSLLQQDVNDYSDDIWSHRVETRPKVDPEKGVRQDEEVETELLATPVDAFSPSFARQVFESPCYLHLDQKSQSKSNTLPSLSRLDVGTEQQTSTTTPIPLGTDSKPSRPTLARINTSEKVKNVDMKREEASSIPSLSLMTTKLTPRSATSKMRLNEQPLSLVHPRLLSIQPRRGTEPSHQDDHHIESLASSSGGNIRSLSLLTGQSITESFEASEIIKGFLYLGPDITTVTEVDYLKNQLGVKYILNAAIEIEQGGGKHLNLHRKEDSGIEKYIKISLKDLVEGQEIQSVMDEACNFIEEAKSKSAPIYVHCKAGKSRSVMLIMAYLIHSNHWTLQEAYAYVVERRREISPNIGFVAELMAFEKRRLQTSKSDAPNVAQM